MARADRPGLDERPVREGVLPERGRREDEQRVVRRERLAQPPTVGGQATINFDRGCSVRLVENQRFTVRDSNDCAALAAAVETTVLPATASTGGGNFAGAAAVVGLGVIGAAVWDRNRSGGSANTSAAAGGTNVSPE